MGYVRLRVLVAVFVSAMIPAILGFAQSDSVGQDSPLSDSDVIEALEIGAVEARTGALLLSGQVGGEVDGALIWSASHREDDGRVTVPFFVEVDGAALLSGPIGRRLAIGLYAYVVDDDGTVVNHVAQGLILDPEVYAQKIIASGLKFVGQFDLMPGDYALRVMVRNQRTGSFFMSWSLLTLSAAEDAAPQLLPPLFPDDGLGWVVARQAGFESAAIFDDGINLLAAARPVLVEDRAVEVWLGGGGWDENARVGVRIINELGRTVSEPVVDLSGATVGGFEFRRATLTPVDLPPGDYTLLVTLSDDQTGEELRRGLPVVVSGRADQTAWVADGVSGETDASPVEAQPRDVAPKMNKKKIRAAYRSALAALGEGDAVAARRRVAELERSVITDPSPKSAATLGEAEYAESKALAKENPQSLVPMALLHRELYRSYLARNEGVLAFHARKMATTYSEQLARLKPGNGFSEGLMVNLAADLAQSGASSAARDLLEQTLRLSPGYRPALLSLGFSFERTGDYIEAATIYRRLVDTHPGYDEGLLRLGVNLIRTGRDDQGIDILQGLVIGNPRHWIKTVATQEMVRFLIERGSLGEAERTARSGITQLPEDQRLRILLAAILEESERSGDAIASVEELPNAGRGVSPRARYGEWPSLGVRASQSNLTARAVEAAPALSSAIQATGGSG